MNIATEMTRHSFPIVDLPLGPFAEPLQPTHESWTTIAPWTDPVAERGAYRDPSRKERIETEFGPAIAFHKSHNGGRALTLEGVSIRNASLQCRIHQDQVGVVPNNDGHNILSARAGLAFRMETIRRHYLFCIEDTTRLVLYRRIDDEWFVLNARRVSPPQGPITLRVDLEGDTITATCPELEIELIAEDSTLPRGKVGYRSYGASTLFDLTVTQTAEQGAETETFAQEQASQVAARAQALPDAVPAGSWDISKGRPLLCGNFADESRNDLLWSTPEGIEARTWEGEVLWHRPITPIMQELGEAIIDGHRRLYLLAGERGRMEKTAVTGKAAADVIASDIVILDGASGEVVTQVPLPEDPDRPGTLNKFDFGYESGLACQDGELDFYIRQWRKGMGGGGVDVWAYDRQGKLLWTRQNETIYGHHNALHWADINGDGRKEMLAGGTCLSDRGELLWTHDLADEMRRYTGAGHYDAVLVQPECNRDTAPPIAFLVGGSAGVYVVDTHTGKTLATHRIGHAQWGLWCNLRDDLPGMECVVGTRWANYGILTCFAASGEKLWTIQPDYTLQPSCPVQWCESGPQHFWINTSEMGMGLYNGNGELAHTLPALRTAFKGMSRLQMPAAAFERSPGGRHWLTLEKGDELFLFKPEDA
ncbi:MAG: FG-GAP repeat domain-containing protein [Planctomycetota bacterium]|jgi:hypothetical protein